MNSIRTTNILLLIITIPLVFYILKTLDFIFVPLTMAMFIALLFLPLMRWMTKKRIPKPISILVIILILVGGLKLGAEIIQLTSREIISENGLFMSRAEEKLVRMIVVVERFFGVERIPGTNVLSHYSIDNGLLKNFGTTLGFISNTLSMTLMTLFFVFLLLSESINFQQMMNSTIFKVKYSSVKTFMKIEKDIIKFVIVKFVISLFTGIGFTLACLFFDVSFPIFWGLFAFLINFVQMVGSVVSVALLSLFAFVELEPTGTLLFFILVLIAVQVVMGGVLEPIFMGKTFSVNVVTILVMLMLWGYLWGIPGMVMSIPLTVFAKIVLEQFPRTKGIARLMAVPEPSRNVHIKRKKRKKAVEENAVD